MCLNSQDCNQSSCMCSLQQGYQFPVLQQPPQIQPFCNPYAEHVQLPTSSNLLSNHLISLIRQQSMMIKIIAEQTQVIAQRLGQISQKVEKSQTQPIIEVQQPSSSYNLLQMLNSSDQQYQYSISSVSPIPDPAYKERAFQLELQVVDQQQRAVKFQQRVVFQIQLYTCENPPKLLKTNTAGDKIMRGTVEADSDGYIVFKKVVVKEVSSHFRNGCFYLVIVPENNNQIKPLVMENFVVKARKTQNTKTQITKLSKIDEVFIEDLQQSPYIISFKLYMAFSLEGDGLLDNLFNYLWIKASNDSGHRGFYIPDTVIYKHQQPRAWYFTSVDGTLKRKGKDKLTSHHIEESFLKHRSLSKIIASYVYINGNQGPRVVEFMGADELKHFLHYRKKNQDGILQKFIDPKGNHNSLLQLLWTPKICLFEFRENVRDIYDLRYDMYERAVTFEGEEYHSRTIAMRGKELKSHLRYLAGGISKHIQEVTQHNVNINRMVLHFKIDNQYRIWLLRATSIRCNSGRAASPIKIHMENLLPDTVNSKKCTVNPQNPVSMQKNVLCKNCEQPSESDQMFDIKYRVVVDAYKSWFQIPKLIKAMHPKISYQDFKIFRTNPDFLNKKALVCDNCFLKLTQKSKAIGAVTPEAMNYNGTGQLDPLKLNRRRFITEIGKRFVDQEPFRSQSVTRMSTKSYRLTGDSIQQSNLLRKPFPSLPPIVQRSQVFEITREEND